MTWQVHVVTADRLLRTVRFAIYQEAGDRIHYLVPGHSGYAHPTMVTRDIQEAPADEETWGLPLDAAIALNDALTQHLTGVRVTDAKLLRDDLLHERGRVDRMLDHVMGSERG